MRLENLERWCRGWNRLFTKSLPVSITVLLVLCVFSCRSTKTISNTSETDSLSIRRKVTVMHEIIPQSIAQLQIPMENLHSLPPLSGYRAEQGQAKLDVKMKGDTLYITATCDSLQFLVYQQEEELTRIRDQLIQSEVEKKAAITLIDLITCGAISFAAGAGVACIIRFIRRKKTI